MILRTNASTGYSPFYPKEIYNIYHNEIDFKYANLDERIWKRIEICKNLKGKSVTQVLIDYKDLLFHVGMKSKVAHFKSDNFPADMFSELKKIHPKIIEAIEVVNWLYDEPEKMPKIQNKKLFYIKCYCKYLQD